jgi:hypothetical protein
VPSASSPSALVGLTLAATVFGVVLASASTGAPLAPASPGHTRAAQDRPTLEGALRNTTPLPNDPDAAARLRLGDEALARVRAGAGAAAWNEAFDAWRSALADSPSTAAVPCLDPGAPPGLFADPDHTLARRAESVPGAVLRRLASLAPHERGQWCARIGPEADVALAAALIGAPSRGPAEQALARVERDFPLSRSAARAALMAVDRAVEQGHTASARTHLARARIHTELAEPPLADVAEALARRAASLAPAATPAGVRRGSPAAGPSTLVPLRALRLESTRRAALAPLGRDVLPGLAEFQDGGLVIHSPRGVVVLDADAAAGVTDGRFHVEPLDQLLEIGPMAPVTTPSAGGWPLIPACAGERFALVIGRGTPGRRFRDLPLPARGNVLAVFERVPGALRPRLVWRLGDLGRLRPGESPPAPNQPVIGPDGAPWASGFEFQPGPIAAEGSLFALARRLTDPTAEEGVNVPPDTLRLFRFDLATGDVEWAVDLTRASELDDEAQRGADGLGFATSAAPLALAAGAVLVSTNVGLFAAVDVADGRLVWAVRNQRRPPGGGGWAGSRAPLTGAGDQARPGAARSQGSRAWFAPFDSDFLYSVPVRPALDSPGFWSAPPVAREGAQDAPALDLGGAPLLAGRNGRFEALERVDPDGRRQWLTYLSEGERIAGRVAALGQRAIVPGDRHLRLVDLEQGGLVLATVPYEGLFGTPLGGDVHVLSPRADPLAPGAEVTRIAVLGIDALWLYELR